MSAFDSASLSIRCLREPEGMWFAASLWCAVMICLGKSLGVEFGESHPFDKLRAGSSRKERD